MARHRLSDQQWSLIEAIFPKPKSMGVLPFVGSARAIGIDIPRIVQSYLALLSSRASRDRVVLLSFSEFPKESWCHLRTTKPIDSTFATIRLRRRKTKGNGSAIASATMIFKLARKRVEGKAKTPWTRSHPDLIQAVRFIDG